jgi:hypothetical protein
MPGTAEASAIPQDFAFGSLLTLLSHAYYLQARYSGKTAERQQKLLLRTFPNSINSQTTRFGLKCQQKKKCFFRSQVPLPKRLTLAERSLPVSARDEMEVVYAGNDGFEAAVTCSSRR